MRPQTRLQFSLKQARRAYCLTYPPKPLFFSIGIVASLAGLPYPIYSVYYGAAIAFRRSRFEFRDSRLQIPGFLFEVIRMQPDILASRGLNAKFTSVKLKYLHNHPGRYLNSRRFFLHEISVEGGSFEHCRNRAEGIALYIKYSLTGLDGFFRFLLRSRRRRLCAADGKGTYQV